jgi:hypothetical protein
MDKEIGKLLSEIWRIIGLAKQRTGGTRRRPEASNHEETDQHACRCTGIAARETWKLIGT